MAPSTWLGVVQGRLADKHPASQLGARLSLSAIGLFVIGFLLAALMQQADTKDPAPSIVLFETAATPDRFAELGAQLPDGLLALQRPLLMDGLFIVAYLVLLSALALCLGPWGYRISALTGRATTIAWLVVLAAGLDVVENLALLHQIHAAAPTGAVLAIAAAAAWAKFLLVGLAILYILGALAGFLVRPGWLPGPTTKDDARAPVELPPTADPRHRVLAISGGGVRSGTFALGVLQRFERGEASGTASGLGWDRVHRVTAVSGGAYMAGAWQVARPPAGSAAAEATGEAYGAPPAPWSRVADVPSPEEVHLRVNLGYLLDPAPAAADPALVSADPAPLEAGHGLGTRRFPQATPRGPAGAVTTLVSGLLVNLVVLLVVLVTVAVPVGWLTGSPLVAPMTTPAGDSVPVPWDRLIPPVLVWLLLGLLFLVLWVFGRRVASTKVRGLAALGSWAERWTWVLGRVALAISAALAVLLLLLPWAMHDLVALRGFGATVTWVQALAASAFVGTVVRTLAAAAKAGPLQPWIARMGGVLLALIAAVVGGWFARAAALAGPGHLPGPAWLDSRTGLALVVLVLALGYLLTNPEWWAPASFYRGRLRLAFALRREPVGAQVRVKPWGGADEPMLADYRTPPGAAAADAAPVPTMPTGTAAAVPGPDSTAKLVVCAAANVSDRSEHTVYGVPAWSLILTPDEVCLSRPVLGGPGAVRYRADTRWVERLWARPDNPRLTTMAAVAMSGAAISPGWGRFSKGSTDSFLALLNVRLGVWLPNPRHAGRYGGAGTVRHHYLDGTEEGTRAAWPEYPRVRLSYLFKELFGVFDPDDPYLYVTDGGHWENSAVVEQLRDQAALELVCVDGSGAAAGRMGTLADAMMLLYEEVGAQLQLDFTPFRIEKDTGFSRAAGVGLVRYGAAGGSHPLGLAWYLRPAISADVPPLAAAYAEQNPAFPNEPTFDQFFSDLQFEAYRVMGDNVAATMLAGRATLLETLQSAETIADLRAAARDDSEDLWAIRDLAGCLTDEDEADYRTLRRALTRPDPPAD